jgi:DNA-binding MarR family transcriptional regulator
MKALPPTFDDSPEDEMRRFWASTFGIVGPEWLIILALADAKECSADIATVSEQLNVDQSFVHSHARRLETQGHIHRMGRGGTTTLSLTTAATAKLATLMPRKI